MSDDSTHRFIDPPFDKPMSQLFQNLRFLLLPNNKAGVTQIRTKLARSHGASINRKFFPKGSQWETTHVLVDQKVLPFGDQAWRKLIETGVALEQWRDVMKDIPVLSQNWMTDSVQKSEIQPFDKYAIILEEGSKSSSTSPKKRKAESPALGHLSKSQQLEEFMNAKVIRDNPNWKAINLLSEMAKAREIEGQQFKVKAYKTAIDTLEKTKEHVTAYNQAIKLPGVGKSIAEKIVEIANTDDLEVLKQLNASEELQLLKLFKGIYGVGDAFAKSWIKEGLKTLDEVAKRDDLSTNQRLGLQYYDDWNEKIPRKECTVHDEYVTQKFHEIDPKVQLTIGGSYRRGASKCGDIDFIVTKPDAEIAELRGLLEKFMVEIKKDGYWQCALTDSISTKWLGGAALTPQWNVKATGEEKTGKSRRVDFLLVPWKEIGASLIYFTGNNEFNKRVRLRAIKRGMTLSEQGLFKVSKDTDGKIVKQELVESFSERKILEILGIAWVEPQARNIGDEMMGS